MQIELKSIKIADLIDGYSNDADTGVKGYGGKLDIRPPYQREFRYDVKQQQAVIDTILKGFPLNIMYWSVGENGTFEMIDGQQRTLSICEFHTHGFNIEDKDRGTLYFSTLTNEENLFFAEDAQETFSFWLFGLFLHTFLHNNRNLIGYLLVNRLLFIH